MCKDINHKKYHCFINNKVISCTKCDKDINNIIDKIVSIRKGQILNKINKGSRSILIIKCKCGSFFRINWSSLKKR